MTAQFPTRQLAKLTGHNGPVHAVTYSAGLGQYILTGSTDRAIRLYNPANAPIDSPSSNPASIRSSSAHHKPKDPSPPGLIQTYRAHGYEVLDVAVTGDNARFASVGGDKLVFLWDVATATTLRRWEGHVARVNCVAFGGESDGVVVSGSFDSTVRLWDVKSNAHKPLMVLQDAKDSVSTVAVAEHEIMTGSIDGRARVYDIRMAQVYVDVIGQPITSITPTKQADSVLVTSLDSTHRLIDKKDGKLLQAYKSPEYANTNYRLRSTLGTNDSVVISGSEDGRIFVWDLLNGQVLHALEHSPARGRMDSKQAVVSAVRFSPARKEWASAGGDGNVVVWGMG